MRYSLFQLWKMNMEEKKMVGLPDKQYCETRIQLIDKELDTIIRNYNTLVLEKEILSNIIKLHTPPGDKIVG